MPESEQHSSGEQSLPTSLDELLDGAYWISKGKVAGRMAEMFDSFRQIFEQGMSHSDVTGTDESAIHTDL